MLCKNVGKSYLILDSAQHACGGACLCACLDVGPLCPIPGRPLVAAQRNGCVEPLAAPRSERTEWEAATCADSLSLTPSPLLSAAWSARTKTQGGKMENESKRKMKERFGLRQNIFKEFLAEFLGIFVLIVSTSLCTCHPD